MGADAIGLRALGFVLVALAHVGYAGYLLIARQLRPLWRLSALAYLAAVVLTAAWGAVSLFDLWSNDMLSWYAVNGLDQLRYAAWCAFMLVLLLPPGEPLAWRRVRPALSACCRQSRRRQKPGRWIFGRPC